MKTIYKVARGEYLIREYIAKKVTKKSVVILENSKGYEYEMSSIHSKFFLTLEEASRFLKDRCRKEVTKRRYELKKAEEKLKSVQKPRVVPHS